MTILTIPTTAEAKKAVLEILGAEREQVLVMSIEAISHNYFYGGSAPTSDLDEELYELFTVAAQELIEEGLLEMEQVSFNTVYFITESGRHLLISSTT